LVDVNVTDPVGVTIRPFRPSTVTRAVSVTD
jgi:hypothetical protein